MRKFNIGDRVIIYRPEDISERPTWIGDMDRFHGMEGTIVYYNSSGFFQIEGTHYIFNDNWAELVGNELKLEDIKDVEFF